MIMSRKSPNCIDTISVADYSGPAVLSLWQQTLKATTAWLTAIVVSSGVALFVALERYRQRKALSYLDDRLLEDIGLTRKEAEREFCKPFWRK